MASTQHGPLFDQFGAQAHDPHGAQQDEGYGRSTADPAKDTYGDGRQPVAGTGKHGALMDEFGWKTVPPMHGQSFDSDFSQPATLDGVEHGTWYDVFRGGNVEIKYIYGGKDYEGTVLDVGDGEVTVQAYGRNQGGGRHTIGLGQMRELRRMTRLGGPAEDRHPTAHPGNTPARLRASRAESPSAHNAKASGGGRTPVDVATAMGTKFANKTEGDDDDVAKSDYGGAKAPSQSLSSFGVNGHCANGSCGTKLSKPVYEHHAGTNSQRQVARCPSCGTAHMGAMPALSAHKTDADIIADLRKVAEG